MPDPTGLTPLDLDPDVVHKLLNLEAQGQIPDAVKPHIAKARAAGILPPALISDPSAQKSFAPQTMQPGAPPAPSMSFGDEVQAAIPDAWEWLKGKAKSAVKAAGDTSGYTGGIPNTPASGLNLSPSTLGTVAGMGLADAPALPAMGAVGALSAIPDTIKEVYNAIHEGRAPSPAPTGRAFMAGALGEGGARMLGGLAPRSEITPEGKIAQDFFGAENVMPHQITDSALLNFGGNVAEHGPTGAKRVRGVLENQSKITQEKLQEISSNLSPTGASTGLAHTGQFNTGMAGQAGQIDIAQQMTDLRKNSGFPEFAQEFGDLREDKGKADLGFDPAELPEGMQEWLGSHEVLKGKSVEWMHDARSDALAAARSAHANGDAAGQAQALEQAANLQDRLIKTLPDDAARAQYRQIADHYSSEINRLDNPTAEAFRTGKSDDALDAVLDNNLQNYAPFKSGSSPKNTGQTNAQLVGRLKDSMTDDGWNQFQSDLVHRLGQRSVDPDTQLISAKHMGDIINNMDTPTQQAAFGKALPDIQKTLTAVTQVQKYQKSQAGRLFIAIKTGSAGVNLIGGAVGAAGGVLGVQHPKEAGEALAGTSALVLISPYAFSRLLTSQIGRTLLTRAATVQADSNAGQQTVRALQRWVTQNAAEKGNQMLGPSSAPISPPPTEKP